MYNNPTRLFLFNDLVTEGLVAVYNLEDTTDSFGSNNLTNNNAAIFSAAKISNGVELNGTTQSLSIADNAALSYGNNTYASFVGWFKLKALPAAGDFATILSKWQATAGNAEYLIDVNENGRFRFIISTTGSNSFVNQTAINTILADTFYFFACWHDGDKSYLELNNDGNILELTASGFIFNGTSQFRIGTRHEAGDFFLNGFVDAVRIYKSDHRVITAAEREVLYNLGVGRQYEVNNVVIANEFNKEFDQIVNLFSGNINDTTPKIAVNLIGESALTINQNGSAEIAQFLSNGSLKVEINNNGQLVSNLATGTSPLVVSSTNRVDNLNADLLDGLHATDILQITSVLPVFHSVFFDSGFVLGAKRITAVSGTKIIKVKAQQRATASANAVTVITIRLDNIAGTLIGTITLTGNSQAVFTNTLNYTFADIDNERLIFEITTYTGTIKHDEITVGVDSTSAPF